MSCYDRIPDRLEFDSSSHRSGYLHDGYSQTPSFWPLSELRTSASTIASVKIERASSPCLDELATLDKHWQGDNATLIPFAERTIANLYGRSIEEAFGSGPRSIKRRDSWPPPQPPFDHSRPAASTNAVFPSRNLACTPPAAQPRRKSMFDYIQEELDRCDATVTLSEPEPDSMVVDDRDELYTMDVDFEPPSISVQEPPTSPMPQAASPMPETLQVEFSTPLLQESNDHSMEEQNHPTWPSPQPDSPLPHVSSPPSQIYEPQLPPPPPPFQRESLNTQTGVKKKTNRAITQRRSLPAMLHARDSEPDGPGIASDVDAAAPSTSSGSGNSTSNNSGSSSNGARKPKTSITKRQPSTSTNTKTAAPPTCAKCSQSFTRNFDLLRHIKQKHEQVREEDPARTCTHCQLVLSRPDAAMRHVKSIPESCNHVKKKEGKPELPQRDPEYYEACKTQFEKLAEQYRKPKGRKKATAA